MACVNFSKVMLIVLIRYIMNVHSLPVADPTTELSSAILVIPTSPAASTSASPLTNVLSLSEMLQKEEKKFSLSSDSYSREDIQAALRSFLGRLDSHIKLAGRPRYGRSVLPFDNIKTTGTVLSTLDNKGMNLSFIRVLCSLMP